MTTDLADVILYCSFVKLRMLAIVSVNKQGIYMNMFNNMVKNAFLFELPTGILTTMVLYINPKMIATTSKFKTKVIMLDVPDRL